jgi:ABC-type glycerol-3-phosphate transport system permease component
MVAIAHRPKQRTAYVAIRIFSRIALYIVCIALSVAFGLPFLWAVGSSLKTPPEILVFPPKLLPSVPQWGNYAEIWRQAPFGRWLLNTATITAIALVGELVSASLVGYGFARFRFPGRDILFVVVLSTLMLPQQVTVIPVFLLFRTLGWLDSFKPLTIPPWFGGGAFAIFLFRQFFLTIPMDFDEAAKIEGAGSFRIYARILVPLCRPVFITLAIFSFLYHWNDFFHPLVFLNSNDKFPLSLGLTYFQRTAEAGGQATEHLLMAASMTMTFPCLILFLVLQRYFVRGIVMSGLKG